MRIPHIFLAVCINEVDGSMFVQQTSLEITNTYTAGENLSFAGGHVEEIWTETDPSPF